MRISTLVLSLTHVHSQQRSQVPLARFAHQITEAVLVVYKGMVTTTQRRRGDDDEGATTQR